MVRGFLPDIFLYVESKVALSGLNAHYQVDIMRVKTINVSIYDKIVNIMTLSYSTLNYERARKFWSFRKLHERCCLSFDLLDLDPENYSL